MEEASTSIKPFDLYLHKLADDIDKDTLSKTLALLGTLSSSPIPRRDRESINDAYQLMKKMEAYGLINESKSKVLVDILREVHRNDLASEVEVRYVMGFDKHISREELQREIKIRRRQQQKDTSPDVNETAVSENVSTSMKPFDTYLSRLANDIDGDTLSKILALLGTLSFNPIAARDIERIDNPNLLMKKMKQCDLINESKSKVLVDILREVHRNDLASEVEVRYAIGFGEHISKEELQIKVKLHRQQQRDVPQGGYQQPPSTAYNPVQQPPYNQAQQPPPQPGPYNMYWQQPATQLQAATHHNQTGVVTAPPTTTIVPPLGPSETQLTCPTCSHNTVTLVESKPNEKAWIYCFIMFLCGLWCCCCIPFCMDSFKDVTHRCRRCKSVVGKFTR